MDATGATIIRLIAMETLTIENNTFANMNIGKLIQPKVT